jgi:protein-tyrosine-phosphatase/DNA-binding transcriptional ArsR family regulator
MLAEMNLAVRVRIHAALADPHRLAIIDALALGDRTPHELGALVDAPSNLLAHHLTVLEQAGLTERRISAGDRRRRYVVLVPDRLSELLPDPVAPTGIVLFVCTHNSARSQFAAALWRRLPGGVADSAGTDPAPRVHPAAVRAARGLGITLPAKAPKGYEAVAARPALVVSVCDRAWEAGIPFDAPTLHWSVPDPVADGRADAFASAFAEISHRVERLAASLPAA